MSPLIEIATHNPPALPAVGDFGSNAVTLYLMLHLRSILSPENARKVFPLTGRPCTGNCLTERTSLVDNRLIPVGVEIAFIAILGLKPGLMSTSIVGDSEAFYSID